MTTEITEEKQSMQSFLQNQFMERWRTFWEGSPAQSANTQLQEDIEKLNQLSQESAQNTTELIDQLEQLQVEFATIKAEHAQLTAGNGDLESKNEALLAQINIKEDSLSKKYVAIGQLQAKVTELEKSLSATEKQLTASQNTNAELSDKLRKMHLEAERLNSEISAQSADLIRSKAAPAHAQAKADRLEEELTEKTRLINQQAEQIQIQIAKITELERSAEALQKQLNDLHSGEEFIRLKQDIERLSEVDASNRQLTEKLKSFTELEERNRGLLENRRELIRNKDSLLKQIAELQRENTKLQTKHSESELAKQYEALQEKHSNLTLRKEQFRQNNAFKAIRGTLDSIYQMKKNVSKKGNKQGRFIQEQWKNGNYLRMTTILLGVPLFIVKGIELFSFAKLLFPSSNNAGIRPISLESNCPSVRISGDISVEATELLGHHCATELFLDPAYYPNAHIISDYEAMAQKFPDIITDRHSYNEMLSAFHKQHKVYKEGFSNLARQLGLRGKDIDSVLLRHQVVSRLANDQSLDNYFSFVSEFADNEEGNELQSPVNPAAWRTKPSDSSDAVSLGAQGLFSTGGRMKPYETILPKEKNPEAFKI
ncbi:MAG: hypothetical protein K0Q74_363 [Gammaproteobacteria bacterium]|nr:hypothetical protein [Gammaproteobacteria bacterium]